jgi:hypothetical protein
LGGFPNKERYVKKYLDLEYLRKVDLPPGREAVHEGICRGEKIPRETGPRLETIEQWHEVGQVVPIQPHTGDFMIGFPNFLRTYV